MFFLFKFFKKDFKTKRVHTFALIWHKSLSLPSTPLMQTNGMASWESLLVQFVLQLDFSCHYENLKITALKFNLQKSLTTKKMKNKNTLKVFFYATDCASGQILPLSLNHLLSLRKMLLFEHLTLYPLPVDK